MKPRMNRGVSEQKLNNLIGSIALITCLIPLGAIVFFSGFLRPIADDYVFASKFSEFGFLSPLNWFEVWSGDLFSATVATILLGLPFALLPLELGSSIAFMVAIFGVGIFTTQVLSISTSLPTRALLLAVPWLTLSWVTAFWIAVVIKLPELEIPFGFLIKNANRDNEFFALGITHWQTINVGYLTVPALLLALTFIVFRKALTQRASRWGLLLFLGFLIGASPLSAVSSIVIIPLGLFLFSRSFNLLRWAQDSASAFVGIIAGLVFSLSSPGATIRRQAVQQGMSVDYLDKLGEAILGLPIALVGWIVTGVSLFSIVAVVFGLVLGLFLMGVNRLEVDSKLLTRSIIFFVISSLVIYLVSSALAKVTYEAWWQTLTGRLFIFVAATMFGVWLGLKIRQSNLFTKKFVAIVIMLVTTLGLFSIVASTALIDSITTRHGQWVVGDASLPGITDISSEWVLEAARKVNNPFWNFYQDRLD